MTDSKQTVAELERRLQASLVERDELLQQQAATNEVLQVINASSGDLAPVFDAILERAMRLCEAQFGLLATYDDGQIRTVAARGVPPAFAEFRKNNLPDYGPGTGPARILAGERVVHIADLKSGEAYRTGDPNRRAVVDLGGARTVLLVPLLKNEAVLGYITVYRKEVRLYSDKQIHVLQNFADQAVIAIENARLFKETREALERQTATADILKVIASSPSDVQPVFDAIVTNAVRLSDGFSAGVYRFVDDNVHLGAFTSINPGADEALRASFPRPFADLDHFRIVRQTGKAFPVPDTEDQPHARLKALARARGFRSLLHVPLKSGATSIGTIAISRKNPGPFSAHHVELLQTFADQAVIAVENVRLFNETKEALERQTATADILKVIASSPSNLQPVFDAIAHRSNELLHGHSTTVFRLIDDLIELAAFTRVNEAADAALRAAFPRPRLELSGLDLVFRGEEHDTIDAQSDAESRSTRDLALARGFRGRLVVPLKSDRGIIGAISITRKEPGAFAYKDKELLRTFADQAVIAIENARLFNETKEALERQTATADILKVIASSPDNVQPVFNAIAESARRVVGAHSATVTRVIGEQIHLAAFTTTSEAGRDMPMSMYPQSFSAPTVSGKVVRTCKVVLYADTETEGDGTTREVARARGFRSVLGVPMLRDGSAIGAINVTRAQPGPFDENTIGLMQTLADQAVIAIQNVQLFNETQEALERQTATAEILKVIADSPSDVQPVFEAIAERSNQLMGGLSTAVYSIVDDVMHLMAFTRTRPQADAALRASFPRPLSDAPWADQVRRGEVVEIPDADAEFADQPTLLQMARLRGFRSVLFVPLLRDGATIGIIGVTRPEPGTFAPNHVQLLQTFANQAVIAIGNVRLFDEVQARTRELTESLEQQTATSEVLEVISASPGELEPVFQKMLENATRVCGANFGMMQLWNGETFSTTAAYNVPPAFAALREGTPIYAHPQSGLSDVLESHEVVHIHDVTKGPAYLGGDPNVVQLADIGGARTVVLVPMLKDDEFIGTFTIYRQEVRPFTNKQIALVENFTKQAVIAIENTRLLKELRQRTNDLSESLEQQTATSEVLETISSSPGELEPVFQKMLQNATRVCGANFGSMNLWDGEKFTNVARHNMPPAFAALQQAQLGLHPDTPMAEVVKTHQVVHVDDFRNNPAYRAGIPHSVAIVDIAGARTLVVVPMLKEDELIGAITIFRQEVRPFTDKQIALVENFTKQAVIAIENTRLLRELRQRTNDLSESLEQQTATSEVLKVISNSPGELDPVFTTMLSNATRICEANFGMMYRYDNGQFHPAALLNVPPALVEYVRDRGSFLPPAGTPLDRLFRTKEVTYTVDETAESNPGAPARLGGARSLVGVPMLKENELIGAIIIYRQEVRPFTDKQVELVTSFANQAVIAIENTRLLKELRQRTEDLSLSLEELRTAQDRLIQTEKLASLGQLTAGIAHEIKNPLNFVNNFSALSSELIDEMNDVLKDTKIDDKKREEIDELTHMLKGNLEKVVQHGKRADSIVKNMLLHSREGSREHRSADINSLLDESLNLAYHGARAEKGEFNIILQRDFDADAGTIELFPQEITRAFLNLIANGVYAATRRKTEDKEPGFEPTLRATTKNLGSTVEIRIRDNGTGIPAEVREKMFNPFFTTKPAGEGTGLGLSMTHDIIVKQHGGRIDVTTEPGQFTEFTIVLPRKSNLSGGDRGKT